MTKPRTIKMTIPVSLVYLVVLGLPDDNAEAVLPDGCLDLLLVLQLGGHKEGELGAVDDAVQGLAVHEALLHLVLVQL